MERKTSSRKRDSVKRQKKQIAKEPRSLKKIGARRLGKKARLNLHKRQTAAEAA